ncbi:MAG: segregation/condensation protein A [Firmicutes bacterium]|nr:segregation/condensation protein A [Bacillota bacterium]
MSFLVSIDQFDGPLDLMLHLIKENKLDLFDLNMDILASQYISYIHQMQDFHLEVASEYLTELASLIEYKSRKLLPREKVEVEEEYEEDTREKLVSRLIEYQKYKEISQTLRVEFENRQQLFSRPASSLIEEWQKPIEDGPLSNQSPYELMRAMSRVMQRMTILKPYETKVTIKEISVEDRLETIKERMKNRKEAVSFEEICNDCSNTHMVIVSFLAILDMIHQKLLNFSIDDQQRIWLMKGEV